MNHRNVGYMMLDTSPPPPSPPPKLSNDGGSDSVRSRITKLRLLWRGIIRECAHEGVTQHYKCTNGASEIKHCLCSCCLHPVSGRRQRPDSIPVFFRDCPRKKEVEGAEPRLFMVPCINADEESRLFKSAERGSTAPT